MGETTDKFSFVAADEAATLRCAGWLAHSLAHSLSLDGRTGCVVTLQGDLGAGKTAFARGFIQARCGVETIVPSPSFALIQPYDETYPPIWHVDLYRLSDASEIDELGLLDVLESHICLIEWAERAQEIMPPAAISVVFVLLENETRHIEICGPKDILTALETSAMRESDLIGFLGKSGGEKSAWVNAQRHPIAGDASTRRYERLTLDSQSAILMDWVKGPDGPAVYDGKSYSQVAHLAEAMPAYCRMVDWLGAHGLMAPRLLARDEHHGFALMEDFGNTHLANTPTLDKPVFYYEAVETLLHLQGQEVADFLPAYDGQVQAVEAGLFLDWYLPAYGIEISDTARQDFFTFWQVTGDALFANAPVTVLRDYHSVNLLWRAKAQGRFRIGLIDVQDALYGHAAYDLASLLCDARLDVTPHQQEAGLTHYKTARFGMDMDAHAGFDAAYAQCVMQRNLKIAGIFIRLAQRDHKPSYLKHLPRIIGYLRQAMRHPQLAAMVDWFAAHAPTALEQNHD